MSVAFRSPVMTATSVCRFGVLRNPAPHARAVEAAVRVGLVAAGLVGSRANQHLVEILRALPNPVIFVLHSIPSHTNPRAETEISSLCVEAQLVVVMSVAVRQVLTTHCSVDDAKVVVLPWGASDAGAQPRRAVYRTHVACVGSLRCGMGAEYLIEAIAILNSQGIEVTCAIASDGPADAAYVADLRVLAERSAVGHLIRIDVMGGEPSCVLLAAEIAVLPYESLDILVSPSLVESLAAGRPVIATGFPHATELLRDGAGLLVPPRNALALAEAIRVATSDRDVTRAMSARARLLAPAMSWRHVQRGVASSCARLSRSHEQLAA